MQKGLKFRARKLLVELIKVLGRFIFSLLQSSLRRNKANVPSVELYTEQDVGSSR